MVANESASVLCSIIKYLPFRDLELEIRVRASDGSVTRRKRARRVTDVRGKDSTGTLYTDSLATQ